MTQSKILQDNLEQTILNHEERYNTYKEYVVGFLFELHDLKYTQETSNILLIQKEHPEWQKGYLNGIGGKIEPGELPIDAMNREFAEESGITGINWQHFANVICGEKHKVYFYRGFAKIDILNSSKQMTDESIYNIPLRHINHYNVIENLKYLIPLALNYNLTKPVTFYEKGID
jgi:8-oxo-dGTP diphosphatase